MQNTLITLSDNKIGTDTNADNTADFYTASVLSATDYYAFGMSMKERSWQSDKYRYGFNGQERDRDIREDGNHTTAEFWEYSAVIGRRWNIDPKPNVSISLYATFANNPIFYNDVKGDSVGVTGNSKDGWTIYVSAKVLDLSSDPIDVEFFASSLSKEIKTKIEAVGWDRVKVNIEISVAKSMNDVKDSDHLFVLVDNVTEGKGAKLFTNSVGVSYANSKIAYIENGIFSSTKKLTNIAIHEFGHQVGLNNDMEMYDDNYRDFEGKEDNFMYFASGGDKNFTFSQVLKIISNIEAGNVNKGNNYEDIKDGVPVPFIQFSSSNEKPFKGVPKDIKRIPKRIIETTKEPSDNK